MLNDTPWIPAISLFFLDMIVKPDMSVFEYGSGGSTLYFSKRVAHVVSVEHSKEWYQDIKKKIGNNVDYNFIEPDMLPEKKDASDPMNYTSTSISADFRQYVSLIDKYDDFDLVFIDGRSRAACLMHAARKIKSSGWIILDDSDRDYYLKNTSYLFESCETIKCSGNLDSPWDTLFIRNR